MTSFKSFHLEPLIVPINSRFFHILPETISLNKLNAIKTMGYAWILLPILEFFMRNLAPTPFLRLIIKKGN